MDPIADRVEVADVARREVSADPRGVLAAWLYGSVARGTQRPDSDVDVAILTGRPPPAVLQELPFDLEDRLSRALRRRAQAVILDHAPADLVHRVLRDGVLLLDRDSAARIRFEVRKRNEYFDLAPVRALCRSPRGERT